MNKPVILLFAAAVTLGLVTLHLVRELRSERSHAAALQTELEQLRGIHSSFENDRAGSEALPPVTADPAALPRDPPQAPASRTETKPSASAPPPMATFAVMNGGSREEQMKLFREQRERQRALLQDPEYRAATIAQQVDSMRMFQRGLARELGLSDEEYERLLALQAEHQLRSTELIDPFVTAEGRADAAAWQEHSRKIQDLQQRNEQEMKALLGEQKYRDYYEYQQSAGARAEVMQLNMTLAEAGMAMREDQMKPLIRAINESQMQMSRDAMKSQQFLAGSLSQNSPTVSIDFQQRQLDLMREHSKRIRNAAARVLSQEQVDVLMEQQEDRLRMQENQLRLMQAQADAIARGELPQNSQGGQIGFAVAEGYFVAPAPAR
jgi:hypothetical protein